MIHFIWLRANGIIGGRSLGSIRSYTGITNQGLEVLTHVLQSGSITAGKTKKGWVNTGQHYPEGQRSFSSSPFFSYPFYEKTTIDCYKMLSLCSSNISDDEIKLLFLHMPELISQTVQDGGPLDALYDKLGIMKNDDHVSRDNNVCSMSSFTLYD